MDGQNLAAPVIIKRKKKVEGGGHHGGAWKVAYADFVTAMMAFFMLMWLLNATTEKQRKGIADYFSPTIPVNRVSGGGEGAFGGESVFSEDQIAQTGTGASSIHPTEERQAAGTAQTDKDRKKEERQMRAVESALRALGGESMKQDNILRHVVTRVTDEGLVVELYDLPGKPMFRPETAEPTELTRQLVKMIAEVFTIVDNEVAVAGFVRSYPRALRDNPVWQLSVSRAQEVRALLEQSGLAAARVQRVTGYADREPAATNRGAPRNNRIELILLRNDG